ncbi:sulfotransferase domain-containing protein [Enterovibrio sp. ZSDZ35]|uniref:Sulfotransferase domain-containing protein n=1 Tax=Enterovibrio qingdaonensis TaxID=2899818 RepID=A0ABT5QH99_9GAMM|nr:sulfotransferase domain-containing protein [Enterovibrio sp. ZSDZ35]MDD1780362.1 sulfotransferase domain-containing protein [Enterovibrio sp. ZSDZ35]
MLVTTLVLVLTVLVLYVLYVGRFMRWHSMNTQGNAYFGKTLQERREIKNKIIKHAPFVSPFVRFLALAAYNPEKMPKTTYKNVTGPMITSSNDSFKAGSEYKPTEDDIIVATQMRCGTTWMQQIVFELLHKGEGDLTDTGYKHLNSASAWIECSQHTGVPLADSPKLGDAQKRVLKTHFPTSLCPYNEKAKYIYVARHPVSCYASVHDFVSSIAGPFAPPPHQFIDWFCSDGFFWTSWPHHVNGWWDWSQKRDNVTFVHFEELKANPENVVRQIASFLNVKITDEELEKILVKIDFAYMREREEYFEMVPPSVNTVMSKTHFFNGGKSNRHQEVQPHERTKINTFVSDYLSESDYPLNTYYPDVVKQEPTIEATEELRPTA